MATIRDFFDSDFKTTTGLSNNDTFIQFENWPPLKTEIRLQLDFIGNAKYISCFLSEHPAIISGMSAILNNIEEILSYTNIIKLAAGHLGDKPRDASEMVFTRLVYFYTPADVTAIEFEKLEKEAASMGVSVCLRGNTYAKIRSQQEKPLAFISHDYRDKELIARPIAVGLAQLMCPVWYDDFSLKVGDRLRDSIEKGLRECKKCVLILTPNFLSNSGWTKVEFDSIFTRELIEKEDFLLPVWAGVTKEQVFEYSPTLANRLAVNWNLGEQEVTRRLHQSIGSQLYTPMVDYQFT